MRVAGHSAEIRTDYLPNTRVVLPPNAAVEWLAPLIRIPIPHAQISGRISTILSKVRRFTQCIQADSGMLTSKLRSLSSTSSQVKAFSNDPFIQRNVI